MADEVMMDQVTDSTEATEVLESTSDTSTGSGLGWTILKTGLKVAGAVGLGTLVYRGVNDGYDWVKDQRRIGKAKRAAAKAEKEAIAKEKAEAKTEVVETSDEGQKVLEETE